jgi:hypothetical protein
MKKTEIILSLIIIIGIIMRILIVPGRGLVLVIGFSSLAIMYQFLGFAFFNDIPLTNIFKKASYQGISVLRIIGTVALGLSLSVGLLGILFKFQFYPGAGFMLLEGSIFISLCFIVALIRYNRNKSKSYKIIFTRIAIVGGFALVLSLIPKMLFFETLQRNHPEYVHAVKNLNNDPTNKEFQNEVEKQKELIFGSSK